MTSEEILVGAALKGWNAALERADKLFSNLSREELLKEVAPGRNRLIYLWGHLAATHDRMRSIMGLGERIHPEFDVIFLSTPDKQSLLPSVDEIKRWWDELNAALSKDLQTLSVADWLGKHTAVSEEDFAKDPLRNRYAILLSRTQHLSYHLGQTALSVDRR
jgi:hypothetical protein